MFVCDTAAARETVALGRAVAVALRETVADDRPDTDVSPSDCVELTRKTRLLFPRDVAVDAEFTTFTDAARGFGACSATAPNTDITAAKTTENLQKSAMRIFKTYISLFVFYHFFMNLINSQFYSMQQFTAFFTQSPKRRTADLDSVTVGTAFSAVLCGAFSASIIHLL